MATSECVEWHKARTRAGYGLKWHNKKVQYVHRITYAEAHNLELTRDDVICHKCDNPACYNIDHLFLGTHADNYRDSVEKGRNSKGFMLPQTRLSDEQVKEIRVARAAGARVVDLAKNYGVHQSHISKITAAKRRLIKEG